MKTTLFMSAALLFSIAAFSQTAIKTNDQVKDITTVQGNKGGSQVKTSEAASSSTSVSSNTVSAAESKVNSIAEKSKEAITAEKQETIAKAKTEEKEIKKAASLNTSVSASAQSNLKVGVAEKGNKINEKASINSHATMSSAKVKTVGNQLNEDNKTVAAHAARPKPAPIKMNAKVKTNAAIRIK